MSNKLVVEKFWDAMASNDFSAASEFLHEEFILEWPQSGERIRGRDNFAAVNTNFPSAGRWRFTLNHIAADGDLVVTDVSVTDGSRIDRAITFSTVRDGRIWKQVEFWPEPFEAAAWRASWVER